MYVAGQVDLWGKGAAQKNTTWYFKSSSIGFNLFHFGLDLGRGVFGCLIAKHWLNAAGLCCCIGSLIGRFFSVFNFEKRCAIIMYNYLFHQNASFPLDLFDMIDTRDALLAHVSPLVSLSLFRWLPMWFDFRCVS